MRKTNTIIKVTKYILLFMAFVFFAVATVLFVVAKKYQKEGQLTNAQIVDFGHDGDSRTVTLIYEVDGSLYEETVNQYNSSWNVGDDIAIYYNVDHPEKIQIKSMMYFLPIMFGAFGTGFLVAVLIMAFIQCKSKGKQQRLLAEGKKVYVTITEITENYSVRVNGRHPYRAKAVCVDDYTGTTYEMISKNYWEDNLVTVGQQIPAYINPKNSKDYYMDIEQTLQKGYQL